MDMSGESKRCCWIRVKLLDMHASEAGTRWVAGIEGARWPMVTHRMAETQSPKSLLLTMEWLSFQMLGGMSLADNDSRVAAEADGLVRGTARTKADSLFRR